MAFHFPKRFVFRRFLLLRQGIADRAIASFIGHSARERSKDGEMSKRWMRYAVAFVTAASLIAFGSAGDAAQAKKDHAPNAPPALRDQPPSFQYIHCAMGSSDPCPLDPAMERLGRDPVVNRPRDAPEGDPAGLPSLTPTR
jgi:hypothetical protein